MKWVKRFVIFLVVGFALFYLIAYPEAAANAVRTVINALAVVFARSLSSFSLSLVSGGLDPRTARSGPSSRVCSGTPSGYDTPTFALDSP